jgi:hypothetical protein
MEHSRQKVASPLAICPSGSHPQVADVAAAPVECVRLQDGAPSTLRESALPPALRNGADMTSNPCHGHWSHKEVVAPVVEELSPPPNPRVTYTCYTEGCPNYVLPPRQG